MNNCYLLEPPRFDLSWLYKRYNVQYILPDKAEAMSLVNNPELLYSRVREWAADNYRPDEDSFALTGNLVMIVMAVAALQDEFPESPIRLLRYDTETNSYKEIRYGNTCKTESR